MFADRALPVPTPFWSRERSMIAAATGWSSSGALRLILRISRYRPDYVFRLYGCCIELSFEYRKRIGYCVRDRCRRSNGTTLA
jgi:hypothetical protein